MKFLIGYLMIGLIKALGLIPLRYSQKTGRLAGRILWLRRTRSREVARVNLALCYPQLTEAERAGMLRQTLLDNGMIAAEMGPMWGYSQAEGAALIRQVHGEELLDQAIADPRGVILLAPHLGNWELINNYIADKCPITIMYRPAKNPLFNQWMVERRELIGCKLVPTTRAGVKGLFDALKAGGMIGFLPDQEPKLKSGVFAPFMGQETLTPRLPHEMLRKTGAVAIYGFARRLPDAQGFDLHFLAVEDDLYDDDTTVSAASLNRGIERCIEHCPTQYQWTYKRFKRRPDGGKDPYKEANVP